MMLIVFYSKDLEVILKKEYNDKAQHKNKGRDTLSGSEWYAAQAFRGKHY